MLMPDQTPFSFSSVQMKQQTNKLLLLSTYSHAIALSFLLSQRNSWESERERLCLPSRRRRRRALFCPSALAARPPPLCKVGRAAAREWPACTKQKGREFLSLCTCRIHVIALRSSANGSPSTRSYNIIVCLDENDIQCMQVYRACTLIASSSSLVDVRN